MPMKRAGIIVSELAFLLVFGFPVPALASENSMPFNGRSLGFSVRDDAIAYLLRESHSYSPALLLSPVTQGLTTSMFVTAYTSEIAQTDGDPFTTASGTTVHRGTAAANFLPFGSIIQLNGELYTIEDRLNSRYNNLFIVDIWMDSLSEARTFGAQILPVTIRYIPEE